MDGERDCLILRVTARKAHASVFPVNRRIASMMTLVARSTSCQTTLRLIPNCAPSSGRTKSTPITIITP